MMYKLPHPRAIITVLARFHLNIMHVISLTRPSHFSVCNIEKLGIGPGNEANKMSILKRIYHKIQRKKGVLLVGFFKCARQKVTLLSKHILHRVHSTFNLLSSLLYYELLVPSITLIITIMGQIILFLYCTHM